MWVYRHVWFNKTNKDERETFSNIDNNRLFDNNQKIYFYLTSLRFEKSDITMIWSLIEPATKNI